MYLQICQKLGIIPISYYLRHIDDERLVLRHHSIDSTAAKAIAAPLAVCAELSIALPTQIIGPTFSYILTYHASRWVY